MKLRQYKLCKTLFILWIVALIFWMCFIFSNSLANAEESGETSQGVVDIIEEIIRRVIPDFEISDHFVRKLAHFIEFFILGAVFTLSYYIVIRDFKYHISLSLLFGLLVSLIDETLQLFSLGRAAMVKDVWLDFSAVVTSVVCFAIINLFVFNKKSL